MTLGSGGGLGIVTRECCEGVCGKECREGDRPISDIPASAGAPEAMAGCSRRYAAEAPDDL